MLRSRPDTAVCCPKLLAQQRIANGAGVEGGEAERRRSGVSHVGE